MVTFTIWAHVDEVGPRAYAARAMAIPRSVGQRSAPEERIAVCDTREEAEREAARLAEALAADIRRRGNRVAEPSGARA
jgi:hypothetical protein